MHLPKSCIPRNWYTLGLCVFSIKTFCHYVESTILDKVREKVVCAWTNRVRHLGCTTTNRVESAHAVFKRWLDDSKGDLCRGWDTVNQMLENQHNEIQTSFGRSKTVMEHRSGDHRFETAISIG